MSASELVERKAKHGGAGHMEVVQEEKRERGRPFKYPQPGMSIDELRRIEGESYDDEFEDRIPATSEYRYLRAKLSTTARELAKNYVPQMYELLKKAKLTPENCKEKLTNDIGRYWAKNYWMRYLPEEAKDTKKVEAGRKGGEQTAVTKKSKTEEANGIAMEALREIGVNHAGVSPEEFEEAVEGTKDKVQVAAHERSAPEMPESKVSRSATIPIKIDLRQWGTQLMKVMDKAHREGINTLIGEINVSTGQLMYIDVEEPTRE